MWPPLCQDNFSGLKVSMNLLTVPPACLSHYSHMEDNMGEIGDDDQHSHLDGKEQKDYSDNSNSNGHDKTMLCKLFVNFLVLGYQKLSHNTISHYR